MKILFFILAAILAFGCTKKELPEPPRKRLKGVPLVPKKKRMIAATCNENKLIKVAILDTGFGLDGRGVTNRLCDTGHKDFTKDQDYSDSYKTTQMVPVDYHGHGTNVAGIIDQLAKNNDANFCLVILKVYPKDFKTAKVNMAEITVEAVKYATEHKYDIINYSGGGTERDDDEIEAVKAYLDQGGTFIAAAGNEKTDISKNPYYPAMDDHRVIVVGNIYENGEQVSSSNYGSRIDKWEVGYAVEGNGLTMTGTSQAAAVVTGKMVTKQECQK